MSQTVISLLQDQDILQGHVARVRKLIISDDKRIEGKFGMSFLTGEWVEIKEGYPYPAECVLHLSKAFGDSISKMPFYQDFMP